MNATLINFIYMAAAVLFIVGLKMLSRQETARRGNGVSAIGMLLAILATLMTAGLSFKWIFIGLATGTIIGAWTAYAVKMTALPEMVALFNGLGGLASLLAAGVEYLLHPQLDMTTAVAVCFAILIGGVTLTGSLIAYAKLAEKINGKPFLFSGQKIINTFLLIAAVAASVIFCLNPPAAATLLLALIIISLILGVLAVIPIGGADMPVVISLLNSYSGLAAAAAGFVVGNQVLIVSGSLVGASGIILTNIMCRAMNRSLANVLFSGFGAGVIGSGAGGQAIEGTVKSATAEDAYYVLEAARSVVFVPGYGMAVAQAQHIVRELAETLEAGGAEVSYAIHPVAGRMPGHMNVLLAEADVPYEQLVEMDAINPLMATVDVAIVIGANDVVNPAARTDESSPLYGMPVINVEEARAVFVMKRSMSSGFAGVENPLFFRDNTRMLFGDAKAMLQNLLKEFKA